MTRIYLATAVLAALVLAGCQPKSTSSTTGEDTVALGPQFSAKKGLLVPEDTRKTLGIKIAEVVEQKVAATIVLQLRVYQVANGRILATGTVSPDQAKELKAGDLLLVSTSDSRGLVGTITRLNDQLQNATGMIEVLAKFSDASESFAMGDFVQATARLESSDRVFTVPNSALLQCSDGYSVYAVSGEHLVRTPVKVGLVNAGLAEIRDGLYTGDQVVVQPVMALWLTELASVKGGQACCVAPPKGK